MFFLFFCIILLVANALSGTSLVITDPDPIKELEPIFIGATRDELEPINAFSPIWVECLKTPSKLQKIVPAPIFALEPISASPI